jgi:hypothetical protein
VLVSRGFVEFHGVSQSHALRSAPGAEETDPNDGEMAARERATSITAEI